MNRRLWRAIGACLGLGCWLAMTPVALSQDEAIPQPPNNSTPTIPDDGLYFADVIVRGRPVFQVGSLADLSARERAQIINRRLAGYVEQSDSIPEVNVVVDESRQVATLRLNNRILMTVTSQDAEDFGVSTEELADRWSQRLNEALERPPLVIDVGQRLYGTIRQLFEDAVAQLPAILGALIIVGLAWAIAILMRRLFRLWAEQTESSSNTEILIGRLGYGGVWIIGIVIALGVLGLDFGALLGAFGLTSVAIGFSLKDVLSNYISGIILLAARPFGIDDQVVIEDYEGTIVAIDLRATTMRTYDGRMVYIPNQQVFQASVINNTASLTRRSSVIVGIDYSEDITRARQVILEALMKEPTIQPEPEPEVLVQELATSTVNLEIRFWVDSRRQSFLKTTSVAAQLIKQALEDSGIDMPTDIYTLVFRDFPEIAIASEQGTRD